MNKQTLIWTLVVAVPVGLAALATGYVYKETGRLPFQASEETASTTEPAGGSSEQVTESVAEPAADPVQPSQTAEAQEENSEVTTPGAAVKGPSFDVVGVEPTGETVVAGRSDAGAIVALTANGEVVGKSIANEAGEWTIILEEPLKPGDYDVGLEVHDDKGASIEQSEQRLAVSVPEDAKEQPLVVLNSPEGPSDILQKPQGEQQVAQAGNSTSGKEAEETAASTQAEPASGQPEETIVAAITEEPQTDGSAADETEQAATRPAREQSASQEAGVAGTQADSMPKQPEGTEAGADSSVVAETSEPEAQATQTQVAAVSDEQAPAQETSGSAATAEAPKAKPAVSATASVSNGTDTTAAPVTDPSAPTVTVEAVESEKDKVYVAGTGEPGSSVRVYVGEEFQGEAKVNSSGKWLVEGTKNVAEGNVEVRADLIAQDGNSVDARAAVTFEKEQDKQIVLTKVVATGTSGGADSQGAAVQKSLPVVIIRKGDNLWRISRRLYGDGVRYTTIYQANQDQIRDPDLIYPGQVFLTPEGDLNWPKPAEDKKRNG